MQIHQSAEDYLETILMLTQRMGRVRSIDVVNELGYTKASVSIAMKKLRENGYIAVDGEGTTMIRKVAVVQALREAFPDRFQGMYAQEEFPEVSGAKLDTEEVVARDIAENANSELFVAADSNAADADSAEPEKVTGEVVENDENVPDFMKD